MAITLSPGLFRTILLLCGLMVGVAALVIGGVSIYAYVSFENYNRFLESRYTLIPASIAVVMALLLAVGGCVGCTASLKRSKTLLIAFACILVVLIAMMIGIVVTGTVYRGVIHDMVLNRTEALLNNYGARGHNESTAQVDYAQRELECCGVHNYTNWYDTPFGTTFLGHRVPLSCCMPADKKNCTGVMPYSRDMIYERGCFDEIRDLFKSNLTWIMAVGAVLLVFLIMGLISSGILLKLHADEDIPYSNLNE